MPPVRPNEVIKALRKLGFEFVSQKGSHRKSDMGSHIVVVPMHYELKRGTLSAIAEQAGIPLARLLEKIREK
jgi:predicted RNA binding protein YcfA (HicA-like mRNA interferase family)